jgi:hypothetical protein
MLSGFASNFYPSGKRESTVEESELGPLSPPLPLLRFDALCPQVGGPQTVNGEPLKSIPNKLSSLSSGRGDKIFDPVTAKRLSRWFILRSQKEVNFKQMEAYSKHFQSTINEDQRTEIFEYPVYESLMYIESKSERIERDSRRPSEYQLHLDRQQERISNDELNDDSPPLRRTNSDGSIGSGSVDSSDNNNGPINKDRENMNASNTASKTSLSPTVSFSPSLVFDSEFESGNLEKSVRVIGRETLLLFKSSYDIQQLSDYMTPTDVDQEYDLTLRNDINTDGNIQWYYFSAKVENEINGIPVTFPLKVRFNLINMQKKDSLYNYGMKPAIFSVAANTNQEREGNDWFNGGYDICYYKNGLTSYKSGKKNKVVVRSQYTFTFCYTFESPDTVFFAYTFPYTYSDLQRYLSFLENDSRITNIFNRRALCTTLAGNRCDVLTITERTEGAVESKYKPGIIVSGRIHPGESNSSYMIHGIIDFLLSDSSDAAKLRKAFIFTIVPMLNPDGVIHGNYRCSLAGTDLNRRFMDCHPSLHPTIVAFKELIRTIQNNRTIALFLDLHGHSKLKNSFIYGCDLTFQPEKYCKYLASNLTEEEMNQRRIFCRIFPKILCTMSKSSSSNGYFSYRDCSFNVDKSKFGTGRVVSWRDLGVLAAYTIEASFCGNGDNGEKKILKRCFEQTSGSNGNGFVGIAGGTGSAKPRSKSSVKKKKGKKLIPPSFNTSFKDRRKPRINNNEDSDGLDISASGSAPVPGSGDEQVVIDEDDVGIEEDEDLGDFSNENEFVGGDPYNDTAFVPKPVNLADSTVKTPRNIAVPLDSSVLNLLDSYKTAVHYQKSDLITMGKHICQAIYHFANLTHSDLEYEKEMVLQLDRDLKEKQKKDQLMTKYPVHGNGTPSARRSSSVNDNNESSKAVENIRSSSNSALQRFQMYKSEEEIDYYKQAIDKLYGPSPTKRLTSPNRLERFDKENSSEEQRKCDAKSVSNATSPAPHRATAILGDENLMADNNDDLEKGNEDDDVDNDSDNDSEDSNSNNNIVIADSKIDGSAANKTVNSDNSTGGNSGAVPSSKQTLNHPSNLQDMFSNYLAITKMELFESNMSVRCLSKNGVYDINALQQLLQTYSSEFFVEKSTQNIGFRIKCELAIRKLLKLDDKIDAHIASLASYYSSLLEEEADSGNESESNPSLDNQPTSKLLKAVTEGGFIVNALKDALRKKKHKELLLRKRREKKLADKLRKQAEMARKLALEQEKKRKEKEKELRNHIRPFSANSAAKDGKRKSGIHSSLPKFAPLYRMAPSDPKINVPVQIKLVNFKDFDGKRRSSQQYPPPSQFQSQPQPQPQPQSWSQINAVFFDEEAAVSTNVAAHPIGLYDGALASSQDNNSVLQTPKRRGSSIYLNPNNGYRPSTASNASLSTSPSSLMISSHENQCAPRLTHEVVQSQQYPSHSQMLVSNDTTNYRGAPDVLPIIFKNPTGAANNTPPSRRPSGYSFKEVAFDILGPSSENNSSKHNGPYNPAAANARRVSYSSNNNDVMEMARNLGVMNVNGPEGSSKQHPHHLQPLCNSSPIQSPEKSSKSSRRATISI